MKMRIRTAFKKEARILLVEWPLKAGIGELVGAGLSKGLWSLYRSTMPWLVD